MDARTSDDRLLGGRVRLAQPKNGYRVAIDPILLAAAVAAEPAERVLDAGCGTGAAALCLAARLPGCRIVGVERNADAAALATQNILANGMADRIAIVTDDIRAYAQAQAGQFDQVLLNPPFYETGRHTQSPTHGKAAAHGEGQLDFDGWIRAATAALARDGRLTLIHRADRLANILAALDGRFGAAAIFPFWPRAGVEAKRMIVAAIKGRRTPPRLLPGLVLHEVDGRYTPEAEAVLRDAAPLALGLGSH